jgi:hypothetical protein
MSRIQHSVWRRSLGLGLFGLAGVGFSGCSDATSSNDVLAARADVQEEQRELEAQKLESAGEVAEAQAKFDPNRQVLNKPVLKGEAAAESREEAAEAKSELIDEQNDEAEDVQDEAEDVTEEQGELKDTDLRFQATQARDKYLADREAVRVKAQAQLDAMQVEYDAAEENQRADLSARIDAFKDALEQFDDAVDAIESQPVLDWQVKRAAVDTAEKLLTTKVAPQ